MWVANIIDSPAEERAVAIALVNVLGNSASLYGVFLWPSKDAPRYIPGFSATNCWMAMIAVVALVAERRFNKRAAEHINGEDILTHKAELGMPSPASSREAVQVVNQKS